MAALICHHNHAPDAQTVTASSEASGFEAAHLQDWLMAPQWRPAAGGTQTVDFAFAAAVDVDYVAVFGHDLADRAGTCKLRYSTDGGSTWSDAASFAAPTENRVLFASFAAISAADWRLEVASTDAPAIGVLAFGAATPLPYGVLDGQDRLGVVDDYEIHNAQTEGGLFVGRSIVPQPSRHRLHQPRVSDAYLTGDWAAFLRHARRYPFFFCGDPDNHPEEAVYCWEDGRRRPPRYDGPAGHRIEIAVMALRATW